jgi:glucan phosphoethanolaminetransferase (alkaline phosphatase superfamily)
MELPKILRIPAPPLFAAGAILMCIPGLLSAQAPLVALASLFLGFAVMLAATFQSRSQGPWSALWLLVASNLSYWGCYGLWQLRMAHMDSASATGIDPIAEILAIWCFFLFLFLIYECVVLVRAIFQNRKRIPSLIILLAALSQILVIVNFVSEIVDGY